PPKQLDYRRNLAQAHKVLANLLTTTGMPKEAEQSYRDALVVQKKLIADFPATDFLNDEVADTLRALACLKCKSNRFEEARLLLKEALPHHRAAIRNPQLRFDNRKSYSNTLLVLGTVERELGDRKAVLAVAEQLLAGMMEPAIDLFNAACMVSTCIRIDEKDSKLSETERKQLSRADADRAMELLGQSVKAGFNDVVHMKNDTDLDPIRGREDFKKLIADLE